MSKLITVFGATGNQGGSVIKHILADPDLSKEFKIRGITRDVSKPAAQALAKQGVEMKSADMNSEASVADAIRGSHTIFLVTNYWESVSYDVELTQGKNVVDAAKASGENVQHIIASTLLNVTKATDGRLSHVPHFDSKADIEEYVRQSGVPATFYLPGYFMSNYAQMLQRGGDGSFSLAYPVSKEAQFPLVDIAEDTGKFVTAIIKRRPHVLGARVYGAAAYYTPARILAELEEVTGKKTTYAQVDADTYKSFLPDFMAEEMLENHLFVEDPGYYAGASLDDSLALLEAAGVAKPVTWREFIEKSGAFK